MNHRIPPRGTTRFKFVIAPLIALLCTLPNPSLNSSLNLLREARAAAPFIILASTTSTENSGLFEAILPAFTADHGIAVRVVAVGTGQALRLARNGDADVLLVHHRRAEEQLVAAGFGRRRDDVMYNDFVLLGPTHDPAQVAQTTNIVTAFTQIAHHRAPFVSRGDDSGTHKKELEIWQASAVKVTAASNHWYRESGAGMGATLNTASAMDGYTLSDRATWLKFANRGQLKILHAGDPRLLNQYGILSINPARHPHIKHHLAQQFIDWLLSPHGQNHIAAYRIDGEIAFYPNAHVHPTVLSPPPPSLSFP